MCNANWGIKFVIIDWKKNQEGEIALRFNMSIILLLLLITIFTLNGCATSDNAYLEENEVIKIAQESEAVSEVMIYLEKGSKETIIRKVEGMEEEFQVVNYTIEPYKIHYQFDEFFGDPEINQNRITYYDNNKIASVSLEIIENTSFDQVISNVQKKFETDEYEDKGELEDIPLKENHLQGKKMFYRASLDLKGFYIYKINENVLVITYKYPEEFGDGMFPLLESLRTSIKVSN